MALLKGREMMFKAFESGIFSKLKESEQSEKSHDDVKCNSFGYDAYNLSKQLEDVSLENISSDLNDTNNRDKALFTPKAKWTGFKISTPKKTLQRLPITLAQVIADSNLGNVLNEIWKIVHSIKTIAKKEYNN